MNIFVIEATQKGKTAMSNEKHRNNKVHDERTKGFSGIFLSAAKSALIALIISLILSVAISTALLFYTDPTSLVFPLSLAVLYLSSFFAGFLCMRRVGEGALICGIISGAILVLFYMFLSLLFPAESSSHHTIPLSFVLRALIVLFSVFGAYAARHKTSKKRKIKR